MPSCEPPSARQDVPGVVAMAAIETGVSVKGFLAAGTFTRGAVMTRDTIFSVATLLGLAFLGVPLATFSALEGNQIGQSAKS